MRYARASLTFALSVFFAVSTADAKGTAPKSQDIENELKLTPGDEKGNEIKALKTELLVTKSETLALAELERLSKKHSGTRLEPEVKLRLAEMYMRRARTHRFFEVHRDSGTVAQSLRLFPDVVQGGSERTQIKKAIGLYEHLMTKFPYFKSIDLVIFNSGYAYQQLGDDKAAEAKYKRLIQAHSGSPLVPDSLLATAEILYHRRQFEAALVQLRDLRKFPNSRSYAYGLYKSAWCYYNMQDAKSGIKWLEEVVKFGRMVEEKKLDRRLDLRKEALNDLALFYSDSEPSLKAVDYFYSQAGNEGGRGYLMRLVGIYKNHSRFNDIDVVLTGILDRSKGEEGLAEVYEELIWNSDKVKNRKKAVVWLQNLEGYCGQSKKSAKECSEVVVETSRKLAVRWHAQWQALNKDVKVEDESLLSAEIAYALYIRNAKPVATSYHDVRFSYSELLFTRKKYRSAADMYAGIDIKQLKEKDRHGAAYGAVVALERAIEQDSKGKWSDKDEKSFSVAADRYLTFFPKSEFANEILFAKSFIAYDKGRYDEAGKGFYKLGWETPSHQKAVKSQDLYLDILNLKKDYTALKQASALLMKRQMPTDRTTQITKIYREAYFSEIQQMEEKGRNKAAVDSYLAFARENSSHELGVRAWWNASLLQFRTGDTEGGALTCERMREVFPKAPQSKECLVKASQIFEAMGKVERASAAAAGMAELEPQRAAHWKEISADFLSLISRPMAKRDAVQTYITLLNNKDTSAKKAPALVEKVLTISKELKDKALIEQSEQFAQKYQMGEVMAEAMMDKAEALFKRGEHTEAFAVARRIVARDEWPKHYVAKARFLQGQVLEDEYRKQSTKSRAEKLGMVLALKTEKLEKVQKAYQATVAYGDPEVSAMALRRLSDCYFDYSTSVKRAAENVNLKEEEKQALRAEVEQLAIPMEEKGVETLQQAFVVAKKGQLRTGLAAEIENEMNKRNMKEIEKSQRVMEPTILVPASTHVFLGSRTGGD